MTTSETNHDRIHFEHLDVIRFVAAFMIVLTHAYEAWVGWYGQVGILSGGTYKVLTPVGKLVDRFIHNFGIGVDIFFLLSGFLITYILLEEKKRFNSINIKKFLIRRTLRIWPLYFMLIAITPFLVTWLASDKPNYLANLFFVGNFDAMNARTWVYPFAHFWSICVEEHFYIVWPFLIAFLPKKRLLPTFVFLIVGSIAFRIYTSFTVEYAWYEIYLHTISRMDVLVIGAIGAYFYSEKQFEFNLPRYLRYALFGILLTSLFIEPVVFWDSHFLAGFKKYFYTGIIAVLLLDYNFNPKFKHFLRENSIIHYLGKTSYGIYMYSNFLLLIIVKKIMWPFHITNMWVFFAITIFLSLIIPVLSYELVEKHILKLNKRFRMVKTQQ